MYATTDENWVTLAGSTHSLFSANCRAIGRYDLIEDPRFSTNAKRVEHSTELNAIFAGWCSQHTLEEVLAAFTNHGGTIAPVYSIEQISKDPQVQARQMITRVPDKHFRTVAMSNVVPRFTVDRAEVRHAAGDIGQDNHEVFAEWLGLSENRIAELAQAKII